MTAKDALIYDKPVNYHNIIKFTLPTVFMTMFSSAYAMVDGVIVARFIGSVALAAINIVVPVYFFVMGLGFVFGTGGNAIIAARLGAGQPKEARSFFTLILIVAAGITVFLSALAVIFAKPLYTALGANAELLPYCLHYGNVVIAASVFMILEYMFQIFLVTAGKPQLGLALSIVCGCVNVVLDILFVAILGYGIMASAISTAVACALGALLPLFYFSTQKGLLHFCRPLWELREIGRALVNGSSEMVTSLAISLVTLLFNLRMMAYLGEKGVAAISSSLYIQDLFLAAIMGFAMGVAPVISYYYGAEDRQKLKQLLRVCLILIVSASLVLFGGAELFARAMIRIFAGSDASLEAIAMAGFRIFSIGFLFSSFNIFASTFFTALCNGKISAFIAFMRAFVFETGAILLLPLFFEVKGIWWAVPVGEVLTFLLAMALMRHYRKRYGYG